jgi:GSCFA family
VVMSAGYRDPNVGYDIVPRRKNNYPRMNEEFLDLPKIIADFILDEKSKLHFDKNTRFFLQGSCFAENLFAELKQSGYPCFYNAVVEAMNSPLANMTYLANLKSAINDPVRKEIEKANVYILTIGVAPSWFSRRDGQFVFRPDLRNIDMYIQRTATVKEATEALLQVIKSIREINPAVQIVLTLSPVPLGSTFEFSSAIVADCLSKSVLRAAIHEALQACSGDKPIYFPSFEIVRWVGSHAGNAFGDDGLPRHISKEYVKQIIASFLSGGREAGAAKANSP